MIDAKIIAEKIREGEIDINNQELFFSNLIKGFLLKLDDDIKIRDNYIPHIIMNTGDMTMYLNIKGQDQSIEPFQISNEDYVYNKIPRCVVNIGNIDLQSDQITSPCSRGILQYTYQDSIYTFSSEFRRYPVKITCDLKYYVDSFTDLLTLIQQIITKLAFIKVYNITYLGQQIKCSYKIPDNFDGEHLMDIDGTTTDNTCKTLSLSIEVETNIPVYTHQTTVPADQYITKSILNTKVDYNEI